jgi:hypothetical protein
MNSKRTTHLRLWMGLSPWRWSFNILVRWGLDGLQSFTICNCTLMTTRTFSSLTVKDYTV